MGDLVVANVRFDVTGQVSSVKGDSVRAGSYLMASGVAYAENWLPLTTAACSTAGGYRCSGWLEFVTHEAVPVATPISERVHTDACSQGGELTDFGIVYTRERSVDVLQVTGSLLLQIILCCFAALFYSLYLRTNGESLYCEISFIGSPSRHVRPANSGHYAVTVYITMAEGG